jgi:hypothetical protein
MVAYSTGVFVYIVCAEERALSAFSATTIVCDVIVRTRRLAGVRKTGCKVQIGGPWCPVDAWRQAMAGMMAAISRVRLQLS